MGPPTGREIARQVKRVFDMQIEQAIAGKKRFHDWDSRLAEAIQGPLAKVFLRGLKESKGGKDLAADAASQALEASMRIAREVNGTTNEWLADGRDPESVFSAERAVAIGLTEASAAYHAAQMMAIGSQGGRVRWVVDVKPCEKICRKLRDKVRKPGKMFGKVDGVAIYQPPAHVNCRCSLQAVSEEDWGKLPAAYRKKLEAEVVIA
jgi:hypothetical protein